MNPKDKSDSKEEEVVGFDGNLEDFTLDAFIKKVAPQPSQKKTAEKKSTLSLNQMADLSASENKHQQKQEKGGISYKSFLGDILKNSNPTRNEKLVSLHEENLIEEEILVDENTFVKEEQEINFNLVEKDIIIEEADSYKPPEVNENYSTTEPVTTKKKEQISSEEYLKKAREIYLQTKRKVEGIYYSLLTDGAFDFNSLLYFSEHIIKTVGHEKNELYIYGKTGDSITNNLIKIVFDHYDFNYIDHSANVAFLSAKLGLKLNLPENKIVDLFISSLLHDIGKYNFPKEIISKPDAHTEKDKIKINELLLDAFNIIKALSIPQSIFHNIFPRYENKLENFYFRKEESPEKKYEFDELSYIIGLTNTYEAITHSRPWRTRLFPYQVVESLLKSTDLLYPKNIIKTLFMCFSIFPYGSFVRLNTREIAKVININEDAPLRPVVEVLLDVNKHRLTKQRIINIVQDSTFYITEFIPASRLEEIEKKDN